MKSGIRIIFLAATTLPILAGSSPANAQESQQVRKANERPAIIEVASEAEPFEDASVESMASQCARLETDEGDFRFEFFPEEAPGTVRNFLNLVALGAFDTTAFSRIVKDFVVQGGNMSTREVANPDLRRRAARRIPDEPNRISHVRGIVSLARPEAPNSASSHFFILVSDSTHLDGTFAAFGRVIEGMEIVDRINRMEVDGEKPLKPVRLKKASLYQCRK